jgi:L-lactate utilization protein LutC
MERDAFLARLGGARPGPALPDLDPLPHAPTELRPGEDRYERFRHELEAVSGRCERVSPGREGLAVAGFLAGAGATRVALASDLGVHREPVHAALTALGIVPVDYDDVVAERAAMGDLQATVTGASVLVAATGSIVTSALAGRAAALIAPIHVCVASEVRLASGLSEALRVLPDASLVAFQSGPSRTADIEKKLILGMHGPGSTLVVVVRQLEGGG